MSGQIGRVGGNSIFGPHKTAERSLFWTIIVQILHIRNFYGIISVDSKMLDYSRKCLEISYMGEKYRHNFSYFRWNSAYMGIIWGFLEIYWR